VAKLTKAIRETGAYLCIQCGRCSSVCPVARLNNTYSPRRLLTSALKGNEQTLFENNSIWTCLTCGRCNEVCPQDIDYIEMTKAIRNAAQKNDHEAVCSHGGAFQSLMRIMTNDKLQQNRMEWIPSSAKIKTKGDILYFVGCLPYFDAFFSDIGVKTLDAARSVLKLLNSIGVEPVLLPNERCCGHDLIWGGDKENFLKLAKHNIEEIKKSGAKKVIFSCAEGYRTFKIDYEKYMGPLDFEVEHISTFLAPYIKRGEISLKPKKMKITYQDACRLGRHMGMYEEPRELLEAVPELELVEMKKNRSNALCCGTSAWLNCDIYSKRIQMKRLQDALDTGAALLTVACPKCEIHFRCAMNDKTSNKTLKIDIQHFITLLINSEDKK